MSLATNGASSQTLSFSKITGTGNDFLFIDARKSLTGAFAQIPREEFARRLCDRHNGAGADGLVFMHDGAAPGRLKWDFYNSDGSVAEMCGNASRCVGRWADVYLGLKTVELETTAGIVRTQLEGDLVASGLSYVRSSFQDLTYDVAGRAGFARLVNTGVPHAVVEVERLEQARVALEDIKALRFHPLTGSKGANVTFLEIQGPGRFATMTYERGVEGFTLSCGTGVLAAAAVGLQMSPGATVSEQPRQAEVETPGGDLRVSFGENWAGAILTGPARYLYNATLQEEFVK